MQRRAASYSRVPLLTVVQQYCTTVTVDRYLPPLPAKKFKSFSFSPLPHMQNCTKSSAPSYPRTHCTHVAFQSCTPSPPPLRAVLERSPPCSHNPTVPGNVPLAVLAPVAWYVPERDLETLPMVRYSLRRLQAPFTNVRVWHEMRHDQGRPLVGVRQPGPRTPALETSDVKGNLLQLLADIVNVLSEYYSLLLVLKEL